MQVGVLFEFTPPPDAPADSSFSSGCASTLGRDEVAAPGTLATGSLCSADPPCVDGRGDRYADAHQGAVHRFRQREHARAVDDRSDRSPPHNRTDDAWPTDGLRARTAVGGLAGAVRELRRGVVDGLPLRAPFDVPASPLGARIRGQHRFVTQQYELELMRKLAKEADCTLNDLVLYLCGTALRS